jgi:hypothetical protein
MVGLEPIESTLEGVAAIARRGAVPVLSPFRPDPSTPLRNFPPPTADDLERVFLEATEIVHSLGARLGPHCSPCSHNTLASGRRTIGRRQASSCPLTRECPSSRDRRPRRQRVILRRARERWRMPHPGARAGAPLIGRVFQTSCAGLFASACARLGWPSVGSRSSSPPPWRVYGGHLRVPAFDLLAASGALAELAAAVSKVPSSMPGMRGRRASTPPRLIGVFTMEAERGPLSELRRGLRRLASACHAKPVSY